jgi:glycosyltransferase involved in cell wall biosynthesis
MMRVAHIVPALFGPHGIVGGAERYAFELAHQMADRVATTLITFGKTAQTEQVGALRVRTIGSPWLVRGQRTNPFSLEVFREIRSADVVHCHQHHVLVSSAVAAWCRLTRKPVFVSDLGGGGWDVSAYVSTDAWFDGHLHLSEYSRRIHGHAGFARARVVGGGVDTERFCPDASIPRDSGALFVGRLLPHKGISYLIRGLPDGVPLTVAGPVPDPGTSNRLAALAQGKRVTFLHGLDDQALVREYRRAMCIVLPSVYRTDEGYETRVPELLGQTLLEGMACGVPAICTDVASLPEVVEHGVTGFVVPPNDPASLGERLDWLHTHPRDAASMGLAARRRVLAHFTWANTVNRCLDAYHSSLSRGAARSDVSMNDGARGKASA